MDKSIVLSKIIAIYLKNDFIVKKNGHLKMIYKCAGLSDYFEENEELLTPYTYNYSNGRTYENDCVTYEVRKGRLSFRLTAPYSEERKIAASEVAQKNTVNLRKSTR